MGAAPDRRSRTSYSLRKTPTAVRIVGGLAAMIAVGTLVFMLPGMATHPLRLNEAFFTAVSALCVTGLSLITPSQDLTRLGQVALMVMIQIGGVGFMVGVVVMLRLLGRSITLYDRLALRDSLGLNSPRAILRIVLQLLIGVTLIEGVGAVLLWLNWRSFLEPGEAAFYALFHAVSAFCNAGFDLFAGVSPMPRDAWTLTIMSGLIVLGGLGIPVLRELFLQRAHFTLHSKVTLGVYAILIVLGGIGFLVAEARPGGTLAAVTLPEQIKLSLFQSVSSRTAGFAGLPNFETMTSASRWLMMGLMFVGCAPASMGGGITTGAFAVITLVLLGYVRGEPATRVGGRTVSSEAIRRANAVLVISLLAVAAATWLLLMTHPVALEAALFEVVSAFATCGLTLAFTGDLNIFGQILIALMMFWGRLGALTIVLALTRPQPTAVVYYPEASLLIG
jgi:trk system potassium uptake protein TrkH